MLIEEIIQKNLTISSSFWHVIYQCTLPNGIRDQLINQRNLKKLFVCKLEISPDSILCDYTIVKVDNVSCLQFTVSSVLQVTTN